MPDAAADGAEVDPLRRRRLTHLVGAPADRRPVRIDGAGVQSAGADGGVLPALRRRGLPVASVAPADGGAVPAERAGVLPAAADHVEPLVRRRVGALQAVPVVRVGAGGRGGRDACEFRPVAAPADGSEVAANRTAVERADIQANEEIADTGRGPYARGRLSFAVVAPAEQREVRAQSARVETARADGREEQLLRRKRVVVLVLELLGR